MPGEVVLKFKKAAIITGYSCNNNCLFCYDGLKRGVRDLSTGEIKKNLDGARSRGASCVDFLGGEVTIRRDFLELVAYAKRIGFSHVMATSNGRMFSYPEFAEKAVAAGLSTVVFSIHGDSAQLHDALTRSPGSFEQSLAGLENIRRLGAQVCCNFTIVRQNYERLPQTAKMFLEKNVSSAEFIFVHPYGYALSQFDEVVPRLSQVEPFLHEALDAGVAAGAKHWVARYLPVCFMRGYEKHLSELSEPVMEHVGPEFSDFDVSANRKNNGRVLGPACENCRDSLLCEGPWLEYARRRGFGELRPLPGEKKQLKDYLR